MPHVLRDPDNAALNLRGHRVCRVALLIVGAGNAIDTLAMAECVLVLRRNSIDHYRVLTSWDARPGILSETSSELLCSVKVDRPLLEGKTVIGTMFEVHRDQRDQSS